MNPQRQAHLTQIQPQAEPQTSDMQPSGTAQSGYVTPDLGPFECDNCTHFDGQNSCNHPQVQNDPEVSGQVDPEGCCNYFQSAGRETQAEEHGEMNESSTASAP